MGASKPVNTNELRDWAERLGPEDRDYIRRVAAELDAARTERNLARLDARVAAARAGVPAAMPEAPADPGGGPLPCVHGPSVHGGR